MDNVTKIIMIVAGVILTLLIVVVGFNFYTTTKNAGDVAMNDVTDMSNMLNESKFTNIEGQTLSGSQVQSYLNTFSREEVSIAVITNSGGPFYFNYTSSINATTTEAEVDFTSKITANSGTSYANNNAVSKKSEACYVNPSGQFDCSLVRNTNGVIVGVVFDQQ